MKEKRYIIHKYIMAKDVKDALAKEKKQNPDAVFVDDDWMAENDKHELGYKKVQNDRP